MKCEYCGKDHDGSYGSGRFCSKECRGAFCAKGKSTGKRRIDPWKCQYCGKSFSSRHELFDHKHEFHPIEGGSTWNKGLTKETDDRVLKIAQKVSEKYKSGDIHIWTDGKHLPDCMKKKISDSMKKAHKEKRAHNIGESRWNNEPSWPEEWFMRVISNEFIDKNYIREYPFNGFSLDFAWIDKKKCIEIDGEQHQRFEECRKRDLRKNKSLADNGWSILRLIWKDVYVEPKKYIQIAKEFIDGV